MVGTPRGSPFDPVTPLADILADLIKKNGPLSVADYMRLALQHPEFGYYRHGDPLGQGGDFITAPEISQMFGEMIGLWCADLWRQMGKPESFTLLELGPGRGTLMQDALRAAAKIFGFHQALKLHLLESSETLRAKQKEKLIVFHPTYITDLNDLPRQPLIVIANEFFDALPIRQFEKSFDGWHERMVTAVDGKLAFALLPPDETIKLLLPESMRAANPGTVYELSPASMNMVRDLAKIVANRGGGALMVDYGYLVPDGKPTLQAVSNHQFTDVLGNVGESDLTALVDFGLLQRAAFIDDIKVHGPVGQGAFLRALGIELRAEQLKRQATPEQTNAIDKALHRLTNDSEMGTLFKAMAVTSSNLTDVPGF